MEDHNGTVMGYPPEFFRTVYGAPLDGQPAAAATRNLSPPSPAQPQPQITVDEAEQKCQNLIMLAPLLAFTLLGVLAVATIVLLVGFESRVCPPVFQVASASVSSFNLSSSSSSSTYHLTADWDIVFSVRNHRSSGAIFYERIEASVLYHGVSLSSAAVPPFYQDGRDQRLVRASMAASSLSIDMSVADDIDGDWKKGAVNFTVTVDGTVRVSSEMSEGEKHHMTVFCDDVTVGVSSNATAGTMVGGARECNVHLKGGAFL